MTAASSILETTNTSFEMAYSLHSLFWATTIFWTIPKKKSKQLKLCFFYYTAGIAWLLASRWLEFFSWFGCGVTLGIMWKTWRCRVLVEAWWDILEIRYCLLFTQFFQVYSSGSVPVFLHLLFFLSQGSISISMSLHQTSFCFVCTHLTSGQKDGDELRRNADVMEILRKTRFPHAHSARNEKSPETILDHEYVLLPALH
jgi:hypothetical protein